MNRFAGLLQRLEGLSTPARQRDALCDYLHEVPADAAASALHLLRGRGVGRPVTIGALGEAVCRAAGIRPWLFDACLQASGDWAETAAHLLPAAPRDDPIDLRAALARLESLKDSPADTRAVALVQWCSTLDAASRECLLRLALGRWRGVLDDELLQRAVADWAGIDLRWVRLRWAGFVAAPAAANAAQIAALVARSLSNGLVQALPWPMAAIEPAPADAELDAGIARLWHGARRVQLVRRGAGCWLWADNDGLLDRTCGPLLEAALSLPIDTVLHGELMVGEPGQHADRGAFDRWLAGDTRHSRSAPLARPSLVVHDVLEWSGRDQRAAAYRERWALLQSLTLADGLTRSPALATRDLRSLDRFSLRRRGFGGVLWMHRDAPYGAPGSVRLWAAPRFSLRAVLQSLSWVASPAGEAGVELGLALWRRRVRGLRELERLRGSPDVNALMALWAPIAKVWIDQEAAASIGALDELTVKRFGPLRLLRPERVCEIRFDALAPNARRRSGATLLGAQFSGWCDDCTLADVDELERLQAWWPAAQPSVTDNGS